MIKLRHAMTVLALERGVVLLLSEELLRLLQVGAALRERRHGANAEHHQQQAHQFVPPSKKPAE